MMGKKPQVKAFGEWFSSLPHENKVVIAGNHDFMFESALSTAIKLLGDVIYLQDSSTYKCGFKIYGSPWQPWFYDWAFNLQRGETIAVKWNKIPLDTDILITHGPPARILDKTLEGDIVGCEDLLKRIGEVKPTLHVFGHIHEAYGVVRKGETVHVNACNCDRKYRPVNPPIVLDWNGGWYSGGFLDEAYKEDEG